METQRQSVAHGVALGDERTLRIIFPLGGIKSCHFRRTQRGIKKSQVIEEHVGVGVVHHLVELFFCAHIKRTVALHHLS